MSVDELPLGLNVPPGPVEGLRLLYVDGLVDGARVVRVPDGEGPLEVRALDGLIVFFEFRQILKN